jgi:hypothetical protein
VNASTCWIDTQILSVSQAQPYLPDSRAAAAAAAANDLYADLCQAHPGRFTLSPRCPAAGQLRRYWSRSPQPCC